MDAAETADHDRTELRALESPRAIRERLPATAFVRAVVAEGRRRIADAIHARAPRSLVVVVGPCSIHDPEAAIEYAGRLRRVADAVGDRLVVVMRAYLEKPRTMLGWKGLINDPRLDGSCDVAAGLEAARRTLLAINELGVPCGSELLDLATPSYIADLLAWGAIGARTSQSQPHREMASGLSLPVGFKNSTDGAIDGAIAAVAASGQGHTFVAPGPDGALMVARTRGNRDCHVILRGGSAGANHGPAEVAEARARAAEHGLARAVMIDCSHDNSRRDVARQADVCRDVLRRVREREGGILGLQLESHLRAGRQNLRAGTPLEYGVSITDACLGWDDTERLLLEAAESVERSDRAPLAAAHSAATLRTNPESSSMRPTMPIR